MASVRKRVMKDGRTAYQVRWREGGEMRSETFASNAAATKFRGLVDVAGQRYPEGWVPGHGWAPKQAEETPPELTLAAWFPRSVRARPRASEETKRDYRRMFDRHVPDSIKNAPLASLTEEDAGAWVAEMLASGKSPKTVHNIHGLVSTAVAHAVRDGRLDRNVFRGKAAGLLGSSRDQVFLEREEFNILLTHVDEANRDFVEWLFMSGMRFSEATALQWREVDYTLGAVHVRRAFKARAGAGVMGTPKTQRGYRTVVMPAYIMDRLKARDPRLAPGARFDAGEGYVFLNKNGDPIRHAAFWHEHWSPAVKAALDAGLQKRPRIHDLRHSHASLLLGAGVPLLSVSRRLGHSSVAVTGDVYGHRTKDSEEALLRALS